MIFLTYILAVFFAINMGGASFAASFATAYGGKILSRKRAGLLFALFVLLGAYFLGENVSGTLGHDIISPTVIEPKTIVIIFLAAGLSMFIANIMNIPQSTSLVTVAAIAGVGAYYQKVSWATILWFIPFWIILPVLSFLFTYLLAGYVYPPRKINFWVYQKLVNQKNKLRIFVIICSCYNAFSVGTNNVANVAGPLVVGVDHSILSLLIVFALFYGAGSFFFTGPLKTAGEKIVPLGLLTASIIAIVSGTLMIIASWQGIPQSFVMLQMGSLFAISALKHGGEETFYNPLTQKTLYTWIINPIITFGVTVLLMKIVSL